MGILVSGRRASSSSTSISLHERPHVPPTGKPYPALSLTDLWSPAESLCETSPFLRHPTLSARAIVPATVAVRGQLLLGPPCREQPAEENFVRIAAGAGI